MRTWLIPFYGDVIQHRRTFLVREVLASVAVLERERIQEQFRALRLNERFFLKKKFKMAIDHMVESLVVNIHRVRISGVSLELI